MASLTALENLEYIFGSRYEQLLNLFLNIYKCVLYILLTAWAILKMNNISGLGEIHISVLKTNLNILVF